MKKASTQSRKIIEREGEGKEGMGEHSTGTRETVTAAKECLKIS